MKIKRITSGSTFEQDIGYARCVVDDRYIHVSGTTGYDYSTMQLPTEVTDQAEQCMHNIEQALAQVSADFSHVIRVRYLFPERDDFALCKPIFRRCFGANPPAATLQITGLYDPDMRLEVEVTAIRPER